MIRRIIINSGSNVLVMFVKLALTFIMAPILVRSLGNYDYGLWEMLGAIIGYMGMLDMGIKPAISRFTARYNASGDIEQHQLMFSSAFIFMALAGLLLASIFVVWGLWFPQSLAPEGATDTQRYTLLCLVLAAQFIFVFPGYVADSTLEGLQKYHIKNGITLINSLIGSALIYSFITPENGLVLLAVINAVGLSLKYVIYFILLRSAANNSLRPLAHKLSLTRLRELLTFGGKSLIQGISSRIENATDSLVIGSVLGPAMVPFYSIPANLVGQIRGFTWTITHVFMPVFSDLAARGEQQIIVKTYLTASRLTVAMVLLMSAGVMLVGADFISLWMGAEYAQHAQFLILILVGFTSMPMLNPFANRYLTALNQHGIMAKWSPVSAVLNLGLSIPLAYAYGIVGVALGSLIPIGIFVFIYLRRCCQLLEISVLHYIRQCILPSLPALVAMIAVTLVCKSAWAIESYSVLILTAIAASLSYALVFFVSGLETSQRQWFCKRLTDLISR